MMSVTDLVRLELLNIKSSIFAFYILTFLPSGVHKLYVINWVMDILGMVHEELVIISYQHQL